MSRKNKTSVIPVCILRILFLLLTPTIIAFGQIQENYFSDEELKDRGTMNVSGRCGSGIVFGGFGMMKSGRQVTVTRIDDQGNVLWVTEIEGRWQEYQGLRKLITGSDGAIYGFCGASVTNADLYAIFKLDAGTGAVVWTKTITMELPASHLIDLGPDKLLIGFASDYDGYKYTYQFAFVDKATGTSVQRTLGKVSWQAQSFAVALDNNKNIYYNLHDSVFMMSGAEPHAIQWKKSYSNEKIASIQRIHIDQNKRMLLFGSTEGFYFTPGFIMRMDPDNGDILSDVGISTFDTNLIALEENTTHIFAAWKEANEGCFTTKVDKATGAVTWKVNGTGTGSVKDLVLDPNGDIFLTGYRDGKWTSTKLDQNTGAKIFERVIANPDVAQEKESMGIDLYSFNNKIYTLGNIQTFRQSDQMRVTPALDVMDPVTGAALPTLYYKGGFQFPSGTLSITRDADNNMLVLKQTGRSLLLGKYNTLHSALWETRITSEYLVRGTKIARTPSGKIVVVMHGYRQSIYSPYYDNGIPTAVLVKIYNNDGTLSWEQSFSAYTGYENFERFGVLDVYADDNSVFVFCKKDSQVKMRKVTASAVTNEVLIDMWPHLIETLPYVFEDTGTAIRVAGYKNGIGPRIIEIDKSTTAMTIRPLSLSLFDVSNILRLNSDELLISGINHDGTGAVIRYNLTQSAIVWYKKLGSDFLGLQLLRPSSAAAEVIVLGKEKDHTVIHKMGIATGELLGTYKSASASLKDVALIMGYNAGTQEIIYAGYEQVTATADQQPVIGVVNFLNLRPKKTLVTTGAFSGNSVASRLEIAADGNAWVGGNLNIDPSNKAGFVYIVDQNWAHDADAPLLASTVPASGATNVLSSSALELTFNERVWTGTGSIRIFDASTDAAIGVIQLTASNVVTDGKKIRVTPTAVLPANKSLYLKIDNTTFEDASGNMFAGIADKRWTFTTAPLPDTQKPLLADKFPQDGITVAGSVSYLELTFNETIVAGTGNITIFNIYTATTTVIDVSSSDVVIQGTKVRVNLPDALPDDSYFDVSIDNTAFQDIAGNKFAGITDHSWSFLTPSPDHDAPILFLTLPQTGDTKVDPYASWYLFFGEDVVLKSGSIKVFDVNDNMISELALTPLNTSVSGNSVSINNRDLPYHLPVPGNTVYVTIDPGVFEDRSGNAFAGISDKSWSFTLADLFTSPVLVATEPANQETNVAPSSVLKLTFNKDILPFYGEIKVFNAATDVELMSIAAASANVQVEAGKNVTITLPAALPKGTDIYVTIDGNAFMDSYGNRFEGLSGTVWSFSTVPLFDTQAPLLTSTTPASGAGNVSTSASLELNFNENIRLGADSIRVYDAATNALLLVIKLTSSNVVITGTKATITHATPFPAGKALYLKVSDKAFRDNAGNAFAGIADKRWSFSTSPPPDIQGPSLTGRMPANGTTNVDPATSLQLTFNENIVLNTGTIRVVNLATNGVVASVAVPSSNVSVSGAKVTVSLAEPLPSGKSLYIQVTNNTFKDAAGNMYAGLYDKSWLFLTLAPVVDVTAPLIVSTSPANRANLVAPEAPLVINFNEPVVLIPGPIKLIYYADGFVNIKTIDLTASNTTVNGNQVTIIPGTLPSGTTMSIRMDQAVFRDNAGNLFKGITDLNAWAFTTAAAPDLTAPSLVSTVPASGATDVDPDSRSLTMKFSRPVVLKGGFLILLRQTGNAPYMSVELTPQNTTIDQATATVTLPQSLRHDEQLYVKIDAGTFADASGNVFPGINDKRWKFSTEKLVTGVEPTSILGEISIISDGDLIRIDPENTGAIIRGISDAIGRELPYERIEDQVVLKKPLGLFILIYSKGGALLAEKLVIRN